MTIQVLSRELVQWKTTLLPEAFTRYPGVRTEPANLDGTIYLVRATRNALGLLRSHGLLPSEPDFRHTDLRVKPIALKRGLMPHQHIAVDRATRRGSMLLGDQLGLGKSASAAAAASAVQEPGRPTLILAPRYLESVWRDELDAMGLLGPGSFWAAKGARPDLHPVTQGARWLFCHYDILRHWWSTLQFNRFSGVIFDEGHLVKNPKSARGRSAALVTPGTALRMVLTGTPVQNNLAEAHALLTLTTGPGTWGHALDFRRRYAGAWQDEWGWHDGSPTHVDELQLRLDDVYLRRDHSVLEQKLPDRTRRKVEVDLPDAVRTKVKDLLAGYSPAQILEAIRKSQTGKDSLGWIMKLRKATSKAKLKTTIEIVQSLIEQGDSVLVFCWQRETVDEIVDSLPNPNVFEAPWGVHGGHSQDTRDTTVHQWKTCGHAAPLVATYGTLSTGHTLTKANHVVFHDLDLVPATMLQSEGRVYRIGARRPVQSWWVVAKESLDPFIFSLVNRKAPATAVFGEMGTGELADFLGDPAFDKEVQDLLAWTLNHGDDR